MREVGGRDKHVVGEGDGGGAAAERWVVALDGPAASGKSSVARSVARRLGVPFVSSGLLYRAATWVVNRQGGDAEDEGAVLRLLRERSVHLLPSRDGDRVVVDGSDVTAELHTDAVDSSVSSVARHPRVRAWVTERLREIPGSFVIDGRDMGTVVFPDARFKFFLTAPADVRARRRVGERQADLTAVTEAIRRRDTGDAAQSVPSPDAIHIDTGDLTLDEVVERVMEVLAGVEAL